MLALGPSPAVPVPGWPPTDTFQVRRQHVPPGRGQGQGQPASPKLYARHSASGQCTMCCGGYCVGTLLGWRDPTGVLIWGGWGRHTGAHGLADGAAMARHSHCVVLWVLGLVPDAETGPGLHPGSCARRRAADGDSDGSLLGATTGGSRAVAPWLPLLHPVSARACCHPPGAHLSPEMGTPRRVLRAARERGWRGRGMWGQVRPHISPLCTLSPSVHWDPSGCAQPGRGLQRGAGLVWAPPAFWAGQCLCVTTEAGALLVGVGGGPRTGGACSAAPHWCFPRSSGVGAGSPEAVSEPARGWRAKGEAGSGASEPPAGWGAG